MAFKYQALNDSRSSLTSLSSLGSSRSIDSGRQQPRLEFSAAGNASRSSAPCPREPMAEERDESFNTVGSAQCFLANDINVEPSEWIQSGIRFDEHLCVDQTDSALTEPATNQLSGREGCSPLAFQDKEEEKGRRIAINAIRDAEQLQTDGELALNDRVVQKPPHSSVESETGLYIHSSVLSKTNGLRFSRHGSMERQVGPNQTRSDHGKLFKVLQRFSNKRAQQRVEEEAEKRARKSPQHSGTETVRRDKENLSYPHKRPSQKNKHQKKGRFPVSKSNDRLSSGFSGVVCCGENEEVDSEFDDSTNASSEGLLLMGGDDYCGVSHADHQRLCGCRGQQDDLKVGGSSYSNGGGVRGDGSSSSRKYRVRRSSSLNEKDYHACDTTEADAMETRGTFPKSRSTATKNLTRNYSDAKYRKKLHVPFGHFRSRHSPDRSDRV